MVFKLFTWRSKLVKPFDKKSVLSLFKSSNEHPPWYFNALIVQQAQQLRFKVSFSAFNIKKFSAPRSAPNPASVTT